MNSSQSNNRTALHSDTSLNSEEIRLLVRKYCSLALEASKIYKESASSKELDDPLLQEISKNSGEIISFLEKTHPNQDIQLLVGKVKKGEDSSLERLAEVYREFISCLAQELVTEQLSIETLTQAGLQGLRKAANLFDFDQTIMPYFHAYAIWHISQLMYKAIYDAKKVSESA